MNLKQYQQVVYNTAIDCGLNDTQAKIIISQAQHESGNFSSHVFKTDNNLFGLKMPVKRPKTYIERPSVIVMKNEGSAPYAHYTTIQDSVKDLIKGWHVFNKTDWNKITTPEQYAAYLKSRGYYGDNQSTYTKRLKGYFNNLSFFKYTVPVVGTLFLIVIIFFIINNK